MSTQLSTPQSPPSRSDRVHDELQRALLAGEIDLDVRLTEPNVSTFFGTSRTPAREALGRLCAAGLLRRCEYGFAPVRPTLTGVCDLYELRLAIELAGIRRAATNDTVRHDRALLASEHARWREFARTPPVQEPGFVVEDERFHLTVLSAAGNPELVAALEAVNIRIRLVRMHDFMVNSRIETTISEHLGILDALLTGEFDEAETLLRNHIGASLSAVIERVERAISAIDRSGHPSSEIGRALR